MDRLDDLLAAHFGVEAAPPELARRLMREIKVTGFDAGRLLEGIVISATDRGVCLIRRGGTAAPGSATARRLAQRAQTELAQYLDGKRTFFSVPVDLSNVPSFQRAVLAVTRRIPFGEVRSYAWVAERIGHPRAVRAVGTALGRNPVPLIVPCHRVQRSDGGLGGYLFGIEVKDRLLTIERTTPTLIGCTSTRILCRRGCAHEQRVSETRRVVFASLKEASASGYRPCRVCCPPA